MGPRQDAGEDELSGLNMPNEAMSFNGAPAGCRGRPETTTPIMAAVNGLQWGPGRMPGKT